MQDLPADFDARTRWPNCTSISTIRDQANCGSCWAFGTTEAFNDRVCVKNYAGDGPTMPLLSTADTTGCCAITQLTCLCMGCNGGQIGMPWNFFHSKGVVTGGRCNDDPNTCYPYTMPRCNHHVKGPYQDCDKIKQVAPTCSKTCQSS